MCVSCRPVRLSGIRGGIDLRRYTVTESDFGSMPIAGYITEIMQKVASFDGWNVLGFAKALDLYASPLDDEDGEIFIMLHGDFRNKWGELIYRFYTNEEDFENSINLDEYEPIEPSPLFSRQNTLILRLFGHDEEYGLEELEIIF